ncbi:uncharacterized protein LACBIDRAFT_305115 [Laccaria bicolor S238N-H82]|uniref:Predicted protein n=1 Tax=Laccaria bicolor (strain S238N-H82 / ATCC MYA-4686) TaxID=486041 RepID=B0CTG2_LACBS|nr:uncharacterized protein LACBIDRAFT_305115 [Laccaria bicolor S238N-H82]EDR14486.1 predicted protein [Laccaria bicolor S238N-H82]|eukprot:XP_001875045.1 predicted protein [Laccaria bicolor S238N-H82]
MAAVGSSVEEPKTLVDAQPLLKPLTRNWAKGARLEFLNGYIDNYNAALTHPNCEACSDLINKTVNAWFAKFHWTLTVKEDPDVIQPRVPLGEGGFERLPDEDSATKGKVIERMRTSLTNWFDRCTKRASKKCPKSAAANPAAILLDRLLGTDSGPSKLTTGWAVWGKANFPSMKAAFDESFQAGGKPEAQCASECNKFKKLEFEKLSEEEQELWNDKAKKDHQEVKDAYQNLRDNLPELLPPKEAQLALNKLPNVLGPVVHGLGQALGMHITVLLGGPEPMKKGVLNIMSLHQGLNKAPVPKPWGTASTLLCPTYSCRTPVIPVDSGGMGLDSGGIRRNGTGIQWNPAESCGIRFQLNKTTIHHK